MAASLPLIGAVPQRTDDSPALAPQPPSERDRTRGALPLLNDAVREYLVVHGMKLETLAEQIGTSRGNLSRMLNDAQAFPVQLLDALPQEIVDDWQERLHDMRADPIVAAAEVLVTSARRLFRLSRALHRDKPRAAKARMR